MMTEVVVLFNPVKHLFVGEPYFEEDHGHTSAHGLGVAGVVSLKHHLVIGPKHRHYDATATGHKNAVAGDLDELRRKR